MNTELAARQGTLKDKKDALMNDIKSVAVDADDLLKELAASSAEKFTAAQRQVRERVGATRARLDQARTDVAAKARSAADAADGYVKAHPWRMLGVATATALLIGVGLTRRPFSRRNSGHAAGQPEEGQSPQA